jgi:hypothetical protein
VGPAAARLGWPGSGWSPARAVTVGRLPEVGAWPRSWRRPCWASGGSLGRHRGRWLVVGQADRERLERARFAHRELQLVVTTLRGHVSGLGLGRLVSEWLWAALWLELAAALRPQHAVSAARSRLATL